jgi:hypothetical protein
MNRIIIAVTVVGLSSAVAFAQGGGGGGAGGSSAGAGGSAGRSGAGMGSAPIGHAQPRRSTFSNEGGTSGTGGINQVDPADAALDRKIKSICRGC